MPYDRYISSNGVALVVTLVVHLYRARADVSTWAVEGLLDYSDTEAVNAVPSTAGSMATLFIGLVVVFALIAGCAFAVRIWQRGGISKLTRQRHMSLVETLAFGPKRSVALVTVGGKALVLGCGESDIRMLHSFDASDLENELLEDFPDPGSEYAEVSQSDTSSEALSGASAAGEDRVSAFKKRLERTLTGKGDEPETERRYDPAGAVMILMRTLCLLCVLSLFAVPVSLMAVESDADVGVNTTTTSCDD